MLLKYFLFWLQESFLFKLFTPQDEIWIWYNRRICTYVTILLEYVTKKLFHWFVYVIAVCFRNPKLTAIQKKVKYPHPSRAL